MFQFVYKKSLKVDVTDFVNGFIYYLHAATTTLLSVGM